MLWAGGAGKLHQLVAILADEPLLVITGDVMPHLGEHCYFTLEDFKISITHSSVAIKVVEHSNTGLVMFSLNLKYPKLEELRLTHVSIMSELQRCRGDPNKKSQCSGGEFESMTMPVAEMLTCLTLNSLLSG